MLTETIENRYDELFDKYVPAMGKCETLAGEILRAVARIHHRYTNDGDIAWQGYGRETVNPAVRFLGYVCENENLTETFADLVDALFDDIDTEEDYEKLIDRLAEATIEVVDVCQLGERENIYGDMLDYADPHEDVDRDEEEDWFGDLPYDNNEDEWEFDEDEDD